MYTYKIVKVPIGSIFTSKAEKDYGKIIENHAKSGWRLVQIFTPATLAGRAEYYEIIFEMEV